MQHLLRKSIEDDSYLQNMLHGRFRELLGLRGLYLVRGSPRDYARGLIPEDYDIIPGINRTQLGDLAGKMHFPDRTLFGGYRYRNATGRQIDLFVPHPLTEAPDSTTIQQALDRFEFSCDAFAYDLISNELIARSSTFMEFNSGFFSIQPWFLENAKNIDLAYVGVKAIWIMIRCKLSIVESQHELLCDTLALINEGRRMYIQLLIDKIEDLRMKNGFLTNFPTLLSVYVDARSEFLEYGFRVKSQT